MKSNSFSNLDAARLLRRLLFGFACLAGTSLFAASSPSISGSTTTININDAQTATVFNGWTVSVGNSGSATNSITVTVNFAPTNLGTLAPLPSGVTQNGNNYIIGPDADTNVSTALRQLTFTPVNNYIPVPNSSNVAFIVSAVDANTNGALKTRTVTIFSTNDAPTFSVSGYASITDKQATNPFSNVSLTDPDNQGTQQQSIAITLSHTNTGYLLVGSSGFTSNNFTYIYQGAQNTVSNAMKGLTYQPIENVLPVGQYDTNVFRIVDSDGYASVTNTSVKVVVRSVDDAPTMTGTPTSHILVATGSTLSPSPFQTLTLRDVDQNDDINNTNGQTLLWNVNLTGPAPLGQLTKNGSAIGTSYTSSNDPPNATSLLRSLNYIPPSQTVVSMIRPL